MHLSMILVWMYYISFLWCESIPLLAPCKFIHYFVILFMVQLISAHTPCLMHELNRVLLFDSSLLKLNGVLQRLTVELLGNWENMHRFLSEYTYLLYIFFNLFVCFCFISYDKILQNMVCIFYLYLIQLRV